MKIILKDTFSGLIPEELFKAPKHGFGVPIGDWLKTALNDKLEGYASEEFLCDQGIFEPSYICEIIDEHMSGRQNRYSELWTFFVFQNWWERFIA